MCAASFPRTGSGTSGHERVRDDELKTYYRDAQTWAEDRERAGERARRLAWIAAGVASAIALVEAFALFALIPLKREVPYTLLVDRQTGYVQALDPLSADTINADAALTRSFLVQYVIARESFNAADLQEDYRKVVLWSADTARERYIASMQANNPSSPLAVLPPRSTIDVEVRSVSSLSANTALVRYSTVRTDQGGQSQVAQHWASVLTYRYTDAEMSAADRLLNPLGFQVVRFRTDPETLPVVLPDTGDVGPLAARGPAAVDGDRPMQ